MNPILALGMMFGLLIFSAIGIGAALFFFQRYSNPEPSLIQQRLMQIKIRHAEESTFELREQSKRMQRLYKDAEYSNPALGQKLEALGFFQHLRMLISQSGMKVTPDKFFMNNIVLPLILCTLLGVFTGVPPLFLLGPGIAGGSYVYVVFRRKQRLNKFVVQLPDALSLITSSLRAGHSFQSALTVVSTELGEPISAEFSLVVRDINLGIPVKEALNRMVYKLDTLPDVRMFATAVLIQREAGGNLAEVLEKLGYTIRERFKLKGQISALTGQSRLTGYVLGGAPAVLLLGLSVFMYGYVKPLWETEPGHIALGAVVVLQTIGFFFMKKIIDIRV